MSWHSDRRFSTEQEAKSFYAARATRGHRFGGVSTTPRGRDLFQLGLFFGQEPFYGLGFVEAWKAVLLVSKSLNRVKKSLIVWS